MNKIIDIYRQNKQAILYLFFGGCTFVVSMLSFYFCISLNIDKQVSNIISWIIAVSFAYVTNRMFVFESNVKTEKDFIKEITSFFFSRIFTLLIEIIIMYICVDVLSFNSKLQVITVKMFCQIVVIVSNYFLSKFIVFKK